MDQVVTIVSSFATDKFFPYYYLVGITLEMMSTSLSNLQHEELGRQLVLLLAQPMRCAPIGS